MMNLRLQLIQFLEINAHSMSRGFTRCGFLRYNDNRTGPGADALFDDPSPFQGLNLLLNPRIVFEGEGIWFLTYRWAVTCINVHSYQLGMANVFIIY